MAMTNARTSVRTDTGPSLLNTTDVSREEGYIKKEAAITHSWRRIETILKTHSGNSWELGDEFAKLTALNISDREIADRVQRGKTFVNDLLLTAQQFPSNQRKPEYTWWTHDLVRRTSSKIKSLAERLEVSVEFPGTAEAIFDAVKESKARSTKAAMEATMKALLKAESVSKEDFDKLTAAEVKPAIEELKLTSISGVKFMSIRQTTEQVSKNWHPIKFAARELGGPGIAAEASEETDALVISCKSGTPEIGLSLAEKLLAIASGDNKAIADFKRQFLDALPPRAVVSNAEPALVPPAAQTDPGPTPVKRLVMEDEMDGPVTVRAT